MTTSPLVGPSAVGLPNGSHKPRIHLAPQYVASSGREAIEVAALAGLDLDPWQQLVLTDSLGETAEGRWAAYRVGLEVARQNGKGSILEARELAGLFAFGEKLIIHSAHEQATASEHFRRILRLMESAPDFDRRILRAPKGKGMESIELRDGARIMFKTRTGGGGRGFTGDLVVFDEAMILAAAFMAALVPTMAAKSKTGNPQLWFAGSAVDQQKTEHGMEFARVRADALAGKGRMAYFGWNAPFDNPDQIPDDALSDPEVWAQANPSMGIRIAPEYIADEFEALGAREFAVERLGVGDWPSPDGEATVIPLDLWDRLGDKDSELLDPVSLAFDVTPDRSYGAVAVAGKRSDGLTHVEVIDHKRGTDWMVQRVKELIERHTVAGVVCDARGPAGSLMTDMKNAGVAVEPMSTAEHVQGCGQFFDLAQQERLRHIAQPALRMALKGAKQRPLGDAWAWHRQNSTVDISPLVAVTLALWHSRPDEASQEPWFEWV